MTRKDYKEITVPEREILTVLSKSYLCNGMSFAELKSICSFFLTLHVSAGAKVYVEGEEESFLCLIASGSVEVIKGLGLPSKQLITTLGPGESIGELSVIDEQPRSASVVAASDSVLYSLTRRNLIEMHNTEHYIWSKMIYNIAVSLATRLRRTTDLLAENMAGNAASPAKPQAAAFFQQRSS